MITELTPEQEAKFPQYVDKWVNIGINTDPCDFERAKKAVAVAYKCGEVEPPQFVIGPVNNPLEGFIITEILKDWVGKEIKYRDENHLNEILLAEMVSRRDSGKFGKIDLNSQIYGSQEFWLSYYDYFQRECGLDYEGKLDGLMELSQCCGWWIPLKGFAILQHRPEEIHRDAEHRLHRLDGPALKFRGPESKCNIYAVHGVRVTKEILEKKFTAKDIDEERNAEIRRVMIDLYGVQSYLLETKAEVISTDDFGTLYKKDVSDDEAIYMVKVINSTPEPDGTYKDYFLRVDPNAYGGLKTAQQAVASTWRNKDGSFVFPDHRVYDPDIQT